MKTKIFIGITEISGYYKNLKKGLKENGVDCVFIDLSNHPFDYSGDDCPNIFVKLYKKITRPKKFKEKFSKNILYFLSIILRIPIFIWALLHYKIFIFGFGQSFFYILDLPILKLFNKKILFVFHGSDVRPPYIDGSYINIDIQQMKKLTKKIDNRVKFIERYADIIITHPAYAHFHTRKYIKGLCIGIPFDIKVKNNRKQINNTDKIKILHAPSNPIAKGSSIFRESIEYLKRKGYPIEYIEITGRPHNEVIDLMASCDFVLDQAYSDTPLSGFATEAAYFGKPAIVGGYYKDYIYNDYSSEVIPPSLFCHPDEITDAIEKLINDPKYREELGRRAKEFVHNQWTPKEVAKRYLKIINEDTPQNWIGYPDNIIYIHGSGISEKNSKMNIRRMIDRYGKLSLHLSDKPELEQKFIEYALISNNLSKKELLCI